jgi:hypothetical protein
VGIATVAAFLVIPGVALADTYTPTRFDDPSPDGCKQGDCSLREAVIAANAHSGTDVIVLRGGATYNLSRENPGGIEDDNAQHGDLDITGDLRIVSTHHKLATVNANGIDRVFDVAPTGPAAAQFSYLRIRGGVTSGAGGGVHVGAQGEGKFSHAAISGNQAGVGGGIEGDKSSTPAFSNLRITSSTINGNKVSPGGFGGGIDAEGSLTVTNSTITGNNGADFGGGIESPSGGAPLNLSSLTVVKNTASVGGGIRDNGNAGTLRNSIVALNTGSTDPDCSTSGLLAAAGNPNLFSDLTPSTADCSAYGSGAILASTPLHIGKLSHNGGPTATIPLLRGSPAINDAGPDSPSRDQRGYKRGSKPDIGAYEFGAKP